MFHQKRLLKPTHLGTFKRSSRVDDESGTGKGIFEIAVLWFGYTFYILWLR